jgi:large-conductance mechanosensitive channel
MENKIIASNVNLYYGQKQALFDVKINFKEKISDAEKEIEKKENVSNELKNDLRDQVVIITGGTRGIGAGIARAFLSAGAKVIATYQSNEQAANDFKKSLEVDEQERIDLRKFNVSSFSECETFYKSLDEAKKAGANVFAYGHFIQSVVDFFIIAFFIFLAIRFISRLQRKEEAANAIEPLGPSSTDKLLTEIRDLLKTQQQ